MKVLFYYNAHNRLNACIEMIVRAHSKNKNAFIFSNHLHFLNDLNHQLWKKELFIPHLFAHEIDSENTPFVLSDDLNLFKKQQALIFLPFESFEFSLDSIEHFPFVYEIIDHDEKTKELGRMRANLYKKEGFSVQYINLMA